MARIIKNKERWHAITIKPDRQYKGQSEMILVKGGRPYLSIWGETAYAGAYSGRKTLRALARAILRTVK